MTSKSRIQAMKASSIISARLRLSSFFFFNTTSLPALTHLLFPIIKFPSSLFLFTSVFNQLTVSSAKERDKRGPSESERTKKADRPIESGIPPKLAVNRLRIGCFNNPGGS